MAERESARARRARRVRAVARTMLGDGCGAVGSVGGGRRPRRRQRRDVGGLCGGGGAIAAADQAPRPVASILCERMRSGCCQHVCMLWHPPGSSRRAHLEEEVVAAREQQPAGPSQHVDPAGVHIGQSCSTCTCMPHHKAAELHVQQLGGNAWLLIHTCSALLRCTCVGASRSCPTAATGAQVMSIMKYVAAAAATPYVTRCTAASTSARRPRAQAACRTAAPSSGSAAAARTARASRSATLCPWRALCEL